MAVVLIPTNFLWMIPVYVDEIWAVDTKLSYLTQEVNGLDTFLKNQFNRFAEVFLSEASPFPDHGGIDLHDFIKVKEGPSIRFPIRVPYVITFIFREDRFWLGDLIHEWIYLACIKFNLLKYTKGYFIWKQHGLVHRVVKEIKHAYPNVICNMTGIGRAGKASGLINDLRAHTVDDSIEKNWVHIFVDSHLVVGIHGSHMIIPTAFAKGFINIVPFWKKPHQGEDIFAMGKKPADISVFMDSNSSPKKLSKMAVKVLEGLK